MPRPEYRDNRRRARFAVIALYCVLAVDLARAGVYGWLVINFGHVGYLSTLILLERLLAVGKLAGLLACAILFLAWFHRAFRNAFACGLRFFRGPGWAIGGWFLPVLHLAIPPQIAGVMWQQAGRERVGRAGTVAAWWSFCLLSLFAAVIGNQMVLDGRGTGLVRTGVSITTLACLFSVAAAWMAIRLVRKLTPAQESLWLLARAEQAFADAPPELASMPPPRPVSTVPGERPVAGSACAACGEVIATAHDAFVCNECVIPLHEDCMREGACPKCRGRDVDSGFTSW